MTQIHPFSLHATARNHSQPDIDRRFGRGLALAGCRQHEAGSFTADVSVYMCVCALYVQLVVDHVKHAFTCKLNNIAPNVFKDYLAELCRRATHFNVHRTHRVVRSVRRAVQLDRAWQQSRSFAAELTCFTSKLSDSPAQELYSEELLFDPKRKLLCASASAL